MYYSSVSVSTDGAFYLTVAEQLQEYEFAEKHYVYESINEGVTWSVVFEKPEDNYLMMFATTLSTDPQRLVFWTRLVDKKAAKINKVSTLFACTQWLSNTLQTSITILSRGVIITLTALKQESLSSLTKLIFDGQSTVFTTDCRDVYA